MWLYIVLAILGILTHQVVKTMEVAKTKGMPMSLETLWLQMAQNAMALLLAILSTSVLMILWYTDGIEFFGMVKGKFSGGAFFVGYFSSSMLKTIISSKKPKGGP